MTQKIFSSALSVSKDLQAAIQEVTSKVKTDLGENPCDLAILFVSEPYEDLQPEKLLKDISKEISPRCLLACNTSGVITNQKEIEGSPALSLLAMHLPEVTINPFAISPAHLGLLESGLSLSQFLNTDNEKQYFICLADPLTCDVRKLLYLFNTAYKNAPVIGGLASANMLDKENWLMLEDRVYTDGAVGVALSGNIHFETLVSQGCRPIGEPFIITKSQNNVIYELASKPALQVLGEVLEKLVPADQKLAEHSLFAGVAMDEGRHKLERGDFLIRNIIGADQSNGALAIGEMLEVGQTVQFQLRDAATSKEDLKVLLEKFKTSQDAKTEGALLVSCCGRGQGLYGEPNHDAALIQKMRGPIPMAGFFANGEFGIINQINYVHGYTASLTILR